jgi:hypothetical protein
MPYASHTDVDTTIARPDDMDRIARRRAGRTLGWLMHLTVFICVNLVLLIAAASSGRPWHLVPLLGWGLGLAIHGMVVTLRNGGFGIHAHLVRSERERLASPQQTWG